jgi:hypothetical protein
MSTLSQFAGGGATRSVVNQWSSGGVSTGGVNANAANGAREVLSGAVTANTLKDLVSITTGGQIPWLSAYSKNATSRTIRLVVICDGVTVFDATSPAIAGISTGIIAAGNSSATSSPIRFNSSCLIRVASSLSETDNVAVAYTLT